MSSIKLRRVRHHTWKFYKGAVLTGMIAAVLAALILRNFGVQGWSFVLLTIASLLVGALILFVVMFLYNCTRWRDLPDPPRHLKWKQRERFADALRQAEPQTVFISTWDGVEDAKTLADEIRVAFQDGGWTADMGNQHLVGDPVHEYGLWVFGHSLGEKASKARELVGTAFQKANIPVHVDRKTIYAGGHNAEIVIGRFDEHPDSGDLNP